MLLWPLFIMIRLRFTDRLPGKYYYLHQDSAKPEQKIVTLALLPAICWLTGLTSSLIFFFICCFAQFPLEPISNIRSSRKIRKDNMDQNVTSKKENVGPKRDRMLVNVCMHFHNDNSGQWGGISQASETLTLLHADHWEKKGQEKWDFGRITYFSFLKRT